MAKIRKISLIICFLFLTIFIPKAWAVPIVEVWYDVTGTVGATYTYQYILEVKNNSVDGAWVLDLYPTVSFSNVTGPTGWTSFSSSGWIEWFVTPPSTSGVLPGNSLSGFSFQSISGTMGGITYDVAGYNPGTGVPTPGVASGNTPLIPEPAIFFLLSGGFLVLVGFRRMVA